MRVELAARAVREAERGSLWWRENRPAARILFDEELRRALDQIRSEPVPGVGDHHRLSRRGSGGDHGQSPWPREILAAEVDRYDSSPGQALGYMVGALEIRRLRLEAAQALGARFDMRAFHDLVLSDPNVSLAMLGEKVARWTETQRGGR